MSKESDRSDDAEHLPLRFQILSKEAVEEILEEHFAWLITKSDHGQRADLSWALLRGAQLEAVDLEGADLEGADLQGAFLGGAELKSHPKTQIPVDQIRHPTTKRR